jgi:hypothetical protein
MLTEKTYGENMVYRNQYCLGGENVFKLSTNNATLRTGNGVVDCCDDYF